MFVCKGTRSNRTLTLMPNSLYLGTTLNNRLEYRCCTLSIIIHLAAPAPNGIRVTGLSSLHVAEDLVAPFFLAAVAILEAHVIDAISD